MKIGIFYENESTTWGPGKVAVNLKRGLEELGIEYENNEKGDYNILLHGGSCVGIFLEKKLDPKKTLIGPCVEAFMGDNTILSENYENYVAASPWHKDLYENYSKISKGEKTVFYWPCGIDTEFYKPFEKANKYHDYLLYDKNSHANYHYWLRDFFNDKGQNMSYALGNTNYENIGLKAYSDCSKYCISANASETQGFGIMEIMSMNLPIFCLDKNYHWSYGLISSKVESSSCPYFSEECGIMLHMKDYVNDYQSKFDKIKPPCGDIIDYAKCNEEFKINLLKEKFDLFLNNLESYSPRQYILDNHTLKRGAQKLIDIFEQM